MTTSVRSQNWPTTDENGEYIFRVPLQEGGQQPLLDNAFTELMRSQLDEMLKLIVLTYKGERVRVDGFRFLNDPEHVYPIWSCSNEK